MAIEWNQHFSKLYRDYLAAAPAESGIPSALPKRTLEDTSKMKRPFIIVECDPKDSSHRSEFKGHVKIRFAYKLLEDGAEPAEATALITAINQRLDDAVAWRAFIVAKPVLERTGWQILFRNPMPADIETDEAERTREHIIKVFLHAVCPR